MKHLLIRLGLEALSVTGAARVASRWTAGLGAILMFHHVRPYIPRDFEPNRILEITPAFLDDVLGCVKARGYDIIPLGEVPGRLRSGKGRFVALTFDDGYRDNLVHALPVLEKHRAPYTIFVTTGFAERTARLWWSDLEDALDRLDHVRFDNVELPLGDARQKGRAFGHIIQRLCSRPASELLSTIEHLAAEARVDTRERVERLCLDWSEIRALDGLELCTIAAHSITHPLLSRCSEGAAGTEMSGSKRRLEEMLGHPSHHFAYPVGDPQAAGIREFALAREAGFATAVTTRPGVLFPEHAAHPWALPRLSVNGLHQSIREFEALLSGAAFHLFNRGRRINVD